MANVYTLQTLATPSSSSLLLVTPWRSDTRGCFSHKPVVYQYFLLWDIPVLHPLKKSVIEGHFGLLQDRRDILTLEGQIPPKEGHLASLKN